MFKCPPDTLIVFAQVLQEYGFESLPALKEPVVLDIGANVGAFSWAAIKRKWPDATVYAYEPHPDTFALLQDNVAEWRVEAHQAAVVHPKTTETVRLYEGKDATTEASVRDDVRWPHLSQDLEHWHDVPAIDADTLPPCDAMKVDTEGSEVEILTGYRHLSSVKVLLVECHAVGGDLTGQMRAVADLAGRAGLAPIDVRGTTLRFARPELLGGASMPIEGEWALVETVGGSWRFGRIRAIEGGEVTLRPGFECSPSRIIMPVAPPGHPVSVSYVDLPHPYVWSGFGFEDADEIQVRYSSIRRLQHARVAQIFAARAAQASA
jgi:FkbM family methyltransferase